MVKESEQCFGVFDDGRVGRIVGLGVFGHQDEIVAHLCRTRVRLLRHLVQ